MTWWWLLVLGLRAGLPVDGTEACTAELAALDRARASAFASADPDLLGQVYVARSPLMSADAEIIEGYRSRGGRVVGAWVQISRCDEVDRTSRLLRLDVIDALGPAFVRWDDGSTTALPQDQSTRRWITMLRTADGWRISESQPPAPTSDRGVRR